MNAPALIAEARAAGLSLWIEGDRLRMRGAGPPSAGLVAKLKAHKAEILAELQAREQADIAEAIAEKASIIEDSGIPRDQADAQASAMCRVWRYRLTDDPGRWRIMIHFDPDQDPMDPAEALCCLRLRYGEDRVLEVLPNTSWRTQV